MDNYAKKDLGFLGGKKDMTQAWLCIDILEQAWERATRIIRGLEHMKHKGRVKDLALFSL